jgi:hypothetical protein
MKFRGRNKFNAKRTGSFPSKLEAAVYEILLQRERQGEIKDIRRQHSVVLQEGGKEVRIAWKIDFSFTDVKSGKLVYCESKGIEDATFKLKIRMYRAKPPAKLELWRGSYKKPFLSEIIWPKDE